jgi:hypothetical protein
MNFLIILLFIVAIEVIALGVLYGASASTSTLTAIENALCITVTISAIVAIGVITSVYQPIFDMIQCLICW